MFENCYSLSETPGLPTMKLGPRCYRRMFYNCSSLLTVPEFPQTTLAECCYESMFQNCYSLINADFDLIVDSHFVAQSCKSMFENCYSLSAGLTLLSGTVAKNGTTLQK